MTDPRYKMSEETAAYYKDTLALMQKDLFKAGGYDEVYILSSNDLKNAPRPSVQSGSKTGIPLFDEGEGIKQMRNSAHGQDYYDFLKDEISSRIIRLQDAAMYGTQAGLAQRLVIASSPASVSFKLPDNTSGNMRHVGVIFLSDTIEPSILAGGLGISENGRAQISRKDADNVDDFKKFIVLPHEAGHLIDNLGNGRILDMNLPMKVARQKLSFDHHKAEIEGDEYARDIFDEATKHGLTRNPLQGGHTHSALESALHYRTLASVESGLHARRGQIDRHATAPFMKGAPFHGGEADSYKNALLAIDDGIDRSTSKLMGEYVRGDHRTEQTFWSSSIRNCFASAVDDSYNTRKRMGVIQEMITGDAPAVLPKRAGGISEEFRICMTGDFSNRYQLLVQQYNTTAPDTPQGQLLGMYVNAAESEIPEDEVRLAHKVPEQKLMDPAMGMKP